MKIEGQSDNGAVGVGTAGSIDFRRMPGSGDETTDFWAVWEAARRLLPADTSPYLLHGLTGGALRRRDDPLVYNDLSAWIVAGLAALDIRAELVRLPPRRQACVSLLRACLRGGRTAPLLLFGDAMETSEDCGLSGHAEPQEQREAVEANGMECRGAPGPDPLRDALSPASPEGEQIGGEQIEGVGSIAAEAPLLRQRLMVEAVQGLDEIRVLDAAGRRQTVGVSWLLAGTAVLVRLTRQPHQGTRRSGLRAAVRRWAVFAAACPQRLVTPYEEDAPLRRLCVAFLREMAGTRGDRVRGMLRRAAAGLENAAWDEDIQDALDYVRAAVCLEFHLTPTELNALISPPTHLLSDIERRELIYLARAGVRDLRVFAARRLIHEQGHDDALRTLEQLREDPDAWVRAVSR